MPITELNADLIDQGRMMNTLDQAIRKIGAEVVQSWGDHGDVKAASGEISLKLKIGKHKEFTDHFRVDWDIKEKHPHVPAGEVSLCVQSKGTLVVQEMGGSRHDARQESILGADDGKLQG